MSEAVASVLSVAAKEVIVKKRHGRKRWPWP